MGAIDACKTNVRVSLFRLNFKKTLCFISGHDFSRAAKAANDEGFSLALAPAALFPFHCGLGQRSAAQPARRTLLLHLAIISERGPLKPANRDISLLQQRLSAPLAKTPTNYLLVTFLTFGHGIS
jgi:hypothetical protein